MVRMEDETELWIKKKTELGRIVRIQNYPS